MEFQLPHIAIQLSLFLLTLTLLHTLIFSPIVELLEKRKGLTSHKVSEAEEISRRVDILAQQVETSLKEARQEARRKLSAAVQEGNAERSKINETAKQTSQQWVNDRRGEIEAGREQLFRDAASKVDELAKEMTALVIGGTKVNS